LNIPQICIVKYWIWVHYCSCYCWASRQEPFWSKWIKNKTDRQKERKKEMKGEINLPWKRHNYQFYWRVEENKRSASSIQLIQKKYMEIKRRNKERWRREGRKPCIGDLQGNLSSRGSMPRSSPVLIFSSNKTK